jgi:hypothetical protein
MKYIAYKEILILAQSGSDDLAQKTGVSIEKAIEIGKVFLLLYLAVALLSRLTK